MTETISMYQATSMNQPTPDPRSPVLLVEDEQSISEPLPARSRVAAFARQLRAPGLRTLDPDAVLLDLALPDADGCDVCRRLRRDSDVPIIMVTANGTVTDRVVALELGLTTTWSSRSRPAR